MADLPLFPFTTQEDWYGELSFLSADAAPEAISLEGRVFEMPITPAAQGGALIEPVKTLTMETGGGLSLKASAPNTLVFRVPRDVARAFARSEYTADVLEVVSGERHLFMPVRVRYSEPSGILSFISRFVGVKVSFAARLQPIVSPVAITGRQGAPGATIVSSTVPPVPADGKNGDYFIEDRRAAGLGRRMYGPKAGGAWPPSPWTIQVTRYQDVPGLTDALGAKAANDDARILGAVQRQGGDASATLVAPNYGASLPAQAKSLDQLVGVERIVLENALKAGEDLNSADVPLNRILQSADGKCIVLPARPINARQPIVTEGRCAIIGSGSGKGPSPAAHNNDSSSTIIAFFAGDTLTVKSDEACILRDFGLENWPAYRNGLHRGLNVQPLSTANTTGHTIHNVRSSNRGTGIEVGRCLKPTVTDCWSDGWAVAGFAFTNSATTGNQESSPGVIMGNMSWGLGATGAGYYCEAGYADIMFNHALGGAYAVDFAVKLFPAGALRVVRNTFEEQYAACFRARSLDGNIAAMLVFDDNELSIVAHAANVDGYIVIEDSLGNGQPWLTTGSIRRNTMRGQLNGGTTKAKHIWLKGTGSKNVAIEQNDMENLSAATPDGIVVEGGAGNVARDNRFYGPFNRKYAGAAGAPLLVRHPDPVSYGSLPIAFTNVAAGSDVQVADGTPGSYPILPSGPGTRAVWQSGQWVGGGEALGLAKTYNPNTRGNTGAIGAVASASKYKLRDKVLSLTIRETVTTNGTAAGGLIFDLPNGLQNADDVRVFGWNASTNARLVFLGASGQTTLLAIVDPSLGHPTADGNIVIGNLTLNVN